MNVNPETLLDESDEERLIRQRATGVLGSGHTVVCFPNLEDDMVSQQQHRAVCLLRPYAACSYCPHSVFTLAFRTDPEQRYDLVACPKWSGSRRGEPAGYEMTELATCETKPFDFCPSCPSKEELYSICSADKSKEGWFSRWTRLRDVGSSDE